MVKDEVLIVKMYAGSYLEDPYNIGHEAINLYKADDDNVYIYVNPYGWISKSHNDKVGLILLVRYNSSNSKLELLGIVENPTQILKLEENVPDINSKKDTEKKIKEYNLLKKNINKYLSINPEKISYNKTKLSHIYKKNNDAYTLSHVTYKANSILKIKTGCKDIVNKEFDKLNLSSQRLKKFIMNNKEIKNFVDKVKRKEWCEDAIVAKDIKYIKKYKNKNFINIIRKTHDELMFSQLFQYFFMERKKLFKDFAKYIEYEKDTFNSDITVEREKYKIDLLITDSKNNLILIENKIKSDINGKKIDDKGTWIDQLDTYKEYIEKEYHNYKKAFYVFAPDYNKHINEDKIKKKGYKVIRYSKIYKFFESHVASYKHVKYFNEFYEALYMHTKDIDNSFEEEMHERFAAAITRRRNK